jgi:hypothetical protein
MDNHRGDIGMVTSGLSGLAFFGFVKHRLFLQR